MLMVPRSRVGILDGHRNPFSLLVNAQNHELTRLLSARNAGSFNNKSLDPRRKELCMDDFEHGHSVTDECLRVRLCSESHGRGCDPGHRTLWEGAHITAWQSCVLMAVIIQYVILERE